MKQRLEKFLDEYGWKYDFHLPSCLETGWKSTAKFFPVEITWNDSTVVIEVSPFVLLSETMMHERGIPQVLNELNRDLKFVRLCTDDSGAIYLRCELWTEEMTYVSFERALSTLGYYAQEVYPRLLAEVHIAVASQSQKMLT